MSPYKCLKICATGVLAPIVVIGADLHVDPSPQGYSANTGTLAQPFATISRAELAAGVGDTIHLHAGVYRESVRFRASGIEGQPITYQPYDDGSGPDEVTISGFDVIEPGVNGAGQWQIHQGSIYKIQLTSDYGLVPGSSTVLVDAAAQKIARWPNSPAAFDFDWQNMAAPDSASFDEFSAGPQPPFSGTFHTATYLDSDLPALSANAWAFARIDTSPGGGVFQTTGIVTASDSGSITFRYKREGTHAVSEADPYFLWNSLAALDEEGEYFFDIEGISGPAHTLYLWTPGGVSPDSLQVEMKRREYAFDLNWARYIQINDLAFHGAGIKCPPSTSSIEMNRLSLRHCGTGLDLLSTGRAGIWLKGSDHKVRDCTIEASYGGGIVTLGTNTEISNNVIRDCMLYSIGTWDSSNVHVHHNTAFRNGGENITMFSPGSRFNYNHCYHGGLRVTDSASMNSHFHGDLLGMEVAYNWVHSNVARVNQTYGWGGGRGIRMDSNPSNCFIHHNLIWNISAPVFSLVLWSLDQYQVNYQNSMLRAYNNTIDGQINIPGSGSIGGHDIRNNICTEVREFGAELDPHIVRSNYFTIGKFLYRWPGNDTSSDIFLSAPTGDFELKPQSAAIEAGEAIAGITDGFSGAAPDVGALAYGAGVNPHWSAGANLRPKDAANLQFSYLVNPSGTRYIVVSGMPEGRIPATEFKVRLGGTTVLTDYRLIYSTESHTGEAYFEIQDQGLTGTKAVEFSLDGTTFQSKSDILELSGAGLTINSIDVAVTSPEGGSTHTISGTGFGTSLWMAPLDILNATGEDLNKAPIPFVFATKEHIDQSRMKPDCSDLRVVHWETNRELLHWIESGENSDSTLIWVKYTEDSPLPKRFSQIDESTYYLTFGDPNRQSTSDPSVVFDFFQELGSPDLQVWTSANDLAEQLGDGDQIDSWSNSGLGSPLSQPDPSLQPVLRLNQINGFPAASFNGSNFLQINGFPASIERGYTVFAVLKSDPTHDPQGRLVSFGNGPAEPTYVRPGTTTDWNVLGVKRAYTGDVTSLGVGRRFTRASVYMTGEVAELLIFSNLLSDSTGVGMDRVRRYLERKYAMSTTARGMVNPSRLIAPTQFYLGNQLLDSVTIIDDHTAVFTAPVVDPQSQLLPLSLSLSATRGIETTLLPLSFVYFTPAYDQWSSGLPAGLRGEFQDPDADGIPNLIEFVTSSDALSHNLPPLEPHRGRREQGAKKGPHPGAQERLFAKASTEEEPGEPDQGKENGGRHHSQGGLSENPRGPHQRLGHPLILPSFRFQRSTTATDVLLSIDYSSDLENWMNISLDHPNVSVIDPDPAGDGSSVLLELTPIKPLAPRGYYRLRAERVQP
ncbi:MAG: DUF2341 domain-containing protein [Roseibacillus sp.]